MVGMSLSISIQSLMAKIQSREARVAVMGLGYVGLPLLTAFFEAGYSVIGLDPNLKKIEALQSGASYIQDISQEALQVLAASERSLLTTDASALGQADAILICVPTPLHKSKEPDLSFILEAAESIKAFLRPGQLVILESTTYPGTTDEMLLPIFAATGLTLEVDFLLAFSPERIDPGNPRFRVENIPKVVGGLTETCTAAASALYQGISLSVHPVSSARVAETSKILENTFRSVNIALVNEFVSICRTLGVDVWEVIDAAATKPFGFMKFVPGPGIGGHCIPLDPHYLIWKSRLHGFEPRFMALADQINASMPNLVVQMVMDALNEAAQALNGARILVVGVAYKSNVSDARESPAQHILPLLQNKGAHLSYHDPYVSEFRVHDHVLISQPLDANSLAEYDLGLILTAHDCIDYALLGQHLSLIIDTRNIMCSVQPVPARVIVL